MNKNGKLGLLVTQAEKDAEMFVELDVRHGDYSVKVKVQRGEFSRLLANPRKVEIDAEVSIDRDFISSPPKRAS